MNIEPWFLQIPLAVVFALAGLPKLLLPYDRLTGLFVWVSDFRPPTVRLIGALEASAPSAWLSPPRPASCRG